MDLFDAVCVQRILKVASILGLSSETNQYIGWGKVKAPTDRVQRYNT